jgi:7,8-dihydro-6-hydroxymethylpterin-pyrophosphokinase
MSAALWDTAPATQAVQTCPAIEVEAARRALDKWSACLRDIDALLVRDDVSGADKLALAMEKAVAKTNLLACANLITACEERVRAQAAHLRARQPWLF